MTSGMANSFKKKFGENIRELRLSYNLTQPEFSKIVGISVAHLAKIEAGINGVSLERYEDICNAFEIDYEVLRPEKTK